MSEKGVAENESYFAGKPNLLDLPKLLFFIANPWLYPVTPSEPDKARVARLPWKTEGLARFTAVICHERVPLPACQDSLSPSPPSLACPQVVALL